MSKAYKITQGAHTNTIDFSRYKPLQKFIDKLVFKKLKYAIKNFCSNMTPELLQALAPRVYKLMLSRKKIVQLKFKLLGETWPPRIIYSADISNYKVIGFDFREMSIKPDWRLLFTDKAIKLQSIKKI